MAKLDIKNCLRGKLLITAKLRVLTGMHIGGGNDYAPIGAVDSPFVRDPLTHTPIIPGSSVKGKMRTLLARTFCSGYILNESDKDVDVVARCFGTAGKDNIKPARLQFFDLFMNAENLEQLAEADTDTYIGEVKFENTISRITGIANPRQIERVPAGAEFDFKLVYNIVDKEEIEEDLNMLVDGFELLQTDYLGGHGSRGYGRIKLYDFQIKTIGKISDININTWIEEFERSGCL